MKDDKDENDNRKFLKSSKTPTVSTTNKSFLKQPKSTFTTNNKATPKKLATTLESDEFEYEKREVDRSSGLVNNLKLKEVSNKYSDDFDESKPQHRQSYDNNNTTLSSIHDDKRKSFERSEKELLKFITTVLDIVSFLGVN